MTPQEFSSRFDYDPDNDLLGEGGFGKIFKAWDNVRNEFIALKVSKVPADMEEFSLLSEYERVKLLEHPNIARYMDCQRIKLPGIGTHDIALMKYYELGNLSQLLSKHKLSDVQKEKLIEGLMEGIGYLHKQKPLIIHSDLKPSNILVVERRGLFIPLITDFGISRQAKVDDKSYVTNTVGAGTYAYAAPEQWEAKELRPNADLWSFAVLAIYVLFNGKKLPFRSDDISIATESGRIEYMKRIRALDFIPDLKGLPEVYRKMIDACLVVNVKDRVKSIEALYEKMNPAQKAVEENEKTEIQIPKKPMRKVNSNMANMEEKTEILNPVKATLPEPKPIEKKEETAVPVLVEKRDRKPLYIFAGSVLFAGLVGSGVWYFVNQDSKVPVTSLAPPVVRHDTVQIEKKDSIIAPVPKKDFTVAEAIIKKPERKEKPIVKEKPANLNAIYHVVEIPPSFPGGARALKNWLGSRFNYPEEASKSFITGYVKISFIVNRDGSLQDVAVIKSVGYGCDAEALRLVKSMPTWVPGVTGGKAVRVKYNLEIKCE